MSFPLNFSSLDITASAITADQQLISMINHNVANAGTPGYSRQVATLQTTLPYPPPGFPNPGFVGQMGTGTQVTSVQRIRLESLETVYRNENQAVGNFTTSSQILQQIQSVFGEPGSSGVSSLLGNFFQNLQVLSNHPDDLAVRNTVLQSAGQLASGIHSLNNAFATIVSNTNLQVASDVKKINDLANQIANLNKQIREIQAFPGQNANDLLDQRGELIKQLSNLVNIQVSNEPNGSSIVSIGGVALVQDDQVNSLGTYTDSQGRVQIYFPGLQSGPVPPVTVPVPLQSGELYGLINTRDNVLGSITTPGTIWYQVNQAVYQLVQNVNSRHQLGYTLSGTTNVSFFNADPDNDGDVDAGIGADADADGPPGSPTSINWLANINVAITDPKKIAASVATVSSVQNINNLSQTIDPNQTLLTESSAFLTAPAAAGTITINTVNINWNNGETINQILSLINNSGAGVVASFDSTAQKIVLTRDTTANQTYLGAGIPSPNITVSDTAGNLSQVFLVNTTANPPLFPPATNTTGTPGDNTNINFLSRLQNDVLLALGNTSITNFYQQIVGNLGTQTSQAQTNLTAEQSVLQQLDQQRQSISGVNLNEEAIALTKAQESFNAAARVMTAIDEVLNKLINGTGRVGL